MSDKYIEHKISLTENQKKNLESALRTKKPLSIRLSKNSLNGDIPILLTKSQKNKVDQGIKKKTGLDLKLSNAQLQKLLKHGGF